MNYKRIYDNIVDNAKNRILEGYLEAHHIIPKSMGGTNDNENLVKLTAREHYIAHWLLYKIHKNDKMAFAFHMMSNRLGGSRQNSIKYEIARKAFSKHISKLNKGKTLSESHKRKISESKLGSKNPMYGKTHSDDHKEYLRDINTGDKNGFYGKTHSDEFKSKLSEYAKNRTGLESNAYGMRHTKETKETLSKLYKGKPRCKPHEIVKCPHCDKSGIKPNMTRWHFDNCKQRETIL